MGILRWFLGANNEPPTVRAVPAEEFLRFDGLLLRRCCGCGSWLAGDPDDSLHAEGPNRHLCGSCYRTREWDAIEAFEHLGRDG